MPSLSSYCEFWLRRLLSTEPVDRAVVEERLRELYAAVEMDAPKHFLWHASPLEALWAFGALSENHHHLTTAFMKGVRQRSDSLAKLKQVQADVQGRLGASSWEAAVASVG